MKIATLLSDLLLPEIELACTYACYASKLS